MERSFASSYNSVFASTKPLTSPEILRAAALVQGLIALLFLGTGYLLKGVSFLPSDQIDSISQMGCSMGFLCAEILAYICATIAVAAIASSFFPCLA